MNQQCCFCRLLHIGPSVDCALRLQNISRWRLLRYDFVTGCEDHYLGWVENVHLFLGRLPFDSIIAPSKCATHSLKIVMVVIIVRRTWTASHTAKVSLSVRSDTRGSSSNSCSRCSPRLSGSPTWVQIWGGGGGVGLPPRGSGFGQCPTVNVKQAICYRDQFAHMLPTNFHASLNGCWRRISSIAPSKGKGGASLLLWDNSWLSWHNFVSFTSCYIFALLPRNGKG